MIETQLVIKNKVGLHARPAALFVQTANKFKCTLKLALAGNEINAKSILKVLTLGANQGAVVTLRAEGEDEAQAVAAILALVETNFGEPE